MRRKTRALWLCVALGIALLVFFGEAGRPGAWASAPAEGGGDSSITAEVLDPAPEQAGGDDHGYGQGNEHEHGYGRDGREGGNGNAEAAGAGQTQATGTSGVPSRQGTYQGVYRIVINIPAYRLSLFRGDELVKEYPIAVGKAVSPSRIGTCTIVHKAKNPTWFPPDGRPAVPPGPDNPVGSRWMGLSWPGYGIHGTNNPASIGKAVSLGCIRMRDEDARELYDIVPVGTQVEFVYRTIEIEPGEVRPGFIGAHITVHRDIYGRGANTFEAAVAVLAASLPQPAPDLDEDALKAIVATASGKPEPVPWVPRVEVDGRPLLAGAARIDAARNVLVALRPIAEALGCYVHWDQVQRLAIVGGVPVRGVVASGRAYVSLDDLRRLFATVLVTWDPQTLMLMISTRPVMPPKEEGVVPAPTPLEQAPTPAPALPPVPAPAPAPAPAPTSAGRPLFGQVVRQRSRIAGHAPGF
ncbi:MAG: L,D-transpeptidase [Bacillota bacterium]|nr:L,D-transpeptidase [Bacillota bacterium]